MASHLYTLQYTVSGARATMLSADLQQGRTASGECVKRKLLLSMQKECLRVTLQTVIATAALCSALPVV